MRKLIVGALLVAASVSCHAQSVFVPGGFISGNRYQQLSQYSRADYLQGLFDGYMFAPFVAQSEQTTAARLHDCTSQMHMNVGQFVAIVDKFMAENPERWGEQMNSLTYGALFMACKKIGVPLGKPHD